MSRHDISSWQSYVCAYPELLLASQRFDAVYVFGRAYLFFELIGFPAEQKTYTVTIVGVTNEAGTFVL